LTARLVADGPTGQREAIAVLQAGGIIGLPTDTVYGIAVALTTPGGIERLFAVKKRPPDKAIVVLADSLEQVAALVEVPDLGRRLANRYWPGPLTLVLPVRPGARLPLALTAGTRTLGVRVPGHPTPRSLARAVGPLPTTSANRSGEADCRDASSLEAALGQHLDLIVDGGRSPGGVPSTVVDCTGPEPRVLRAGAIPESEIVREGRTADGSPAGGAGGAELR
jgi:L-threonylcarbamoyladenylate synthase